VFLFSWFYRFNDPGGAFAGLTDDHFFYVVRGWQILFGDLPVRDFVDHGAPLYYYIAAAVQVLFGRGSLSEVAFSVTMLSAGAALTFWLAWRASGSLAAALVAALFQILLEPRFYNYPKIVVYTAAIPLLWWFADRPGARARSWLAVVTVIAFLLRHDHGVFVAAAVAALLLALDLPWRERLRHAALYAALVAVLLLPYFVFIQMNGGVVSYFQQASAWAARDRVRAPVVFPGLFDFAVDGSAESGAGGPVSRAAAVVRANGIAWMYYFEIGLPFLALIFLAASRDGFRPEWPRAGPKLVTVIVLGVLLNVGFLRSPLEARLADPSVPHAILIAWLLVALARLLAGRESLRLPLQRHAVLVRLALGVAAAPFAFTVGSTMSANFYERLDRAALVERPGKAIERAGQIVRHLRADWRLVSWEHRPDRSDLITLSMYLNACTTADDRILVQHYLPQVLALARRAFAGGHADLRPGFFNTREAQLLTLERLRRQSVPLVLLESGREYVNFRRSFPLVTAYLDEHYALAGTRLFDGRFDIQLFVRKDMTPRGSYAALGWPCFQ
jgi:hypothetical protein